MSKSRRTQLLLGTALVALAATGCSKLPTAPNVETSMVASPAAPASVVAKNNDPAFVQPPPVPGTGSRSVVRMLGSRGGVASNGNFSVIVPPGAFTGRATVSVTQPDPNQPLVQLDIQPASKNKFKVPVMLIASFPGEDGGRVGASTMMELDTQSGAWFPVSGATCNSSARTVSAPLVHFSTYRVDLPASPPPGPGRTGGKSGD